MKNYFLKYKKPIAITLAVIIIVVLLVIGVSALRKFFKDNAEQSAVEDEIIKSNVTLSKAQLYAFANKLYAAMDGVGTDEDQVISVFEQLKTESDLYSLISTFGTRDDMTLPAWIADELSSKDIGKINGILASKNIDYTF